MITVLRKPDLCPKCGYLFGATTSMKRPQDVPKPGNLTVCICCGELLVFNQDLMVEGIGEGWEAHFREEVAGDPQELAEVERTIVAIRLVQKHVRARGPINKNRITFEG